MKNAVKRIAPQHVPVEIMPPVSKGHLRPVMHVPAPAEEFEEISETTTTTTKVIKRHRVDAAPSSSGEPAASVVGRIVAVFALFFMALICAALSILSIAVGESTMASISFIGAIILTSVTVSTARYQH